GGMIAAKGATGHSYFIYAGGTGRIRGQLVVQEGVIVSVNPCAICWMNASIIPAVSVDGVRAIDAYASCLNKPAGRFDKLEILILVITAHRGWEQYNRIAAVSENKHFNILAQTMSIPPDVLLVHTVGLLI